MRRLSCPERFFQGYPLRSNLHVLVKAKIFELLLIVELSSTIRLNADNAGSGDLAQVAIVARCESFFDYCKSANSFGHWYEYGQELGLLVDLKCHRSKEAVLASISRGLEGCKD